MSLQVEKLEKNMAKLTIEVPAEELEKAINAAYQKSKNKISIPGFRKGKVPRKMIEQMYGREIFYEDAANALVPKSYQEALAECTEDIVSSPEIEVTQIEAGKPFIFTAVVALKPEITLGKYKGIEVAKANLDVTEEEIDAEINRERESNARTITVDDRPVKDGDITVIDFEGFMDGEAFEGGKGENYSLTIGSHTFIPGFEEELIGALIGEEREVNVTFPEDYQEASLAGRPAVFKCIVKEIKEKELPELDDEFASEVSEFDTLEEYKEDIKKKLGERKADSAKAAKEDAVVEAAIEDADMEIPDAMLETQQRAMVEDFADGLRSRGMSMEQYMKLTNTTPGELLDQVKPQALRSIQSRLVLEAVVAAENIQASDEEFEEEVDAMAKRYKQDAEQVKERLGENGKKQLMNDICIRKAMNFMVENAVEV